MSQIDLALQEAEEILSYLEKDGEKLDSSTREEVIRLYANFIQSREDSVVDHTMLIEKHYQLLGEF